MNIIESVRIALGAIWVNKMRSLLTMLGIIIGISSVITVIALGHGMEEGMNEEFANFGVGRIFVGMNWGDGDLTMKDYLNQDDIEMIRKIMPDEITALQRSVSENGKVYPNGKHGKSVGIEITGADHDYQNIQSVDVVNGRFVSENDLLSKRHTIVIDEDLAIKVFGRKEVLGEKFITETGNQTLSWTIVGVYKNKKSAMSGMMGEESFVVYTPLTTLEKAFGMGELIWFMQGSVNLDYNTDETLSKIVSVLERRHDNKGKNRYRVQSMESEMGMVNSFMGGVTAVIGAIAAVSLLVGGIGVMNIMLVSVTERTREIGIRKALGAKYGEIMSQFLIESVIISIIGGMIGTALGIGLSNLIAQLVPFLPKASAGFDAILVAWMFSAGVGVVFGIMPASKAAKMNPIDALRYE